MTAPASDRGDNTARCQTLSLCVNALGRHDRRCPAHVPVPAADRPTDEARCDLCDHAPHPTSHCAFRWPGGLGCSCADRQTDEERCRCRNLADEDMPPAERIGDAETKRRGLWSAQGCALHAARPAVAEAVMADLGAAITEGVTEARLREAVTEWLFATFGPWCDVRVTDADAVLALPEMRALLDAAAKVQRVEAAQRHITLLAMAADKGRVGYADAAGILRAALGGER